MKEITQNDLDKYRCERFKVTVEPAHTGSEYGEIRLSVTTNGVQWQTICLSPIERLKVIRALLLYEK